MVRKTVLPQKYVAHPPSETSIFPQCSKQVVILFESMLGGPLDVNKYHPIFLAPFHSKIILTTVYESIRKFFEPERLLGHQ